MNLKEKNVPFSKTMPSIISCIKSFTATPGYVFVGLIAGQSSSFVIMKGDGSEDVN